ncbi:MAG: hypothetical protein K6E79_07355 [Pseudobutyrivibrio sp.]|nr:hypothetical protein [Pseudobutyrivibrio sp.]
MGFPIFTVVFIIFLAWLTFRLRSIYKKRDASEKEFWDKERAANATPAKDISNLRYINIPIEKFPIHFSTDTDVCAVEEELTALSQKKLLNITGMTNTELKTKYGVPNFEALSQMGEDFDRATVLLNKYGKALVEADRIDDAINVLEFAVGIGTDVSESYTLLGDCYKQKHNDIKLDLLKKQVVNTNLLLKDNILQRLS